MSARDRTAQLRRGAQIRSSAKDIEVLEVREDLSRNGTRMEVRSDSGEKYVMVIRDTDVNSMCSCKGWTMHGKRRAAKMGLPPGLRAPCTHIKTVFEHMDREDIIDVTPAVRTQKLQSMRRGRFELIRWNRDLDG